MVDFIREANILIYFTSQIKILHCHLSRLYGRRLKDVDISAKIIALQLVWVRRLFKENFHPWKLIPLNSLSSIGIKSLFHSNLHLAVDLPRCLPNFYKTIIQHWTQFARYVPSNASEVMFECLFGFTDS